MLSAACSTPPRQLLFSLRLSAASDAYNPPEGANGIEAAPTPALQLRLQVRVPGLQRLGSLRKRLQQSHTTEQEDQKHPNEPEQRSSKTISRNQHVSGVLAAALRRSLLTAAPGSGAAPVALFAATVASFDAPRKQIAAALRNVAATTTTAASSRMQQEQQQG